MFWKLQPFLQWIWLNSFAYIVFAKITAEKPSEDFEFGQN